MNTFGRNFRVSIFGESHGESIGAVIDGVPSGISLKEDDLFADIARRSPGAKGTTSRRESDTPHIISGIYNGYTTGAPLTVVFNNDDKRPADYTQFLDTPRPGHADRTAHLKWAGFNDPRGGGHFSGRLTLAAVAAGCIAKKIVPQMKFNARLVSIGGVTDEDQWDSLLQNVSAEGDSLGGIVRCTIEDIEPSLGEPFWDGAESLISHAVFAIPGVRGIEFGDGFAASSMRGSEHNDPYGSEGLVRNGAGGINGGLTNGAPIVFKVAFKPTSSIAREQRTWNFKTNEIQSLRIEGRHDVCFALRTPVIVEAMAATALADMKLSQIQK